MPVEHTWGVPEYFARLYDTEEKRDQIPSLNTLPPEQWQPGTLVRFRCMVQDTSFGQEIAIDAARTADGQSWRAYRYADGAPHAADDASLGADALYAGQDRVRLNELQLLYCVSVPGETAWARHEYSEKMAPRWGYDPTAPAGSTPGHATKLAAKHPLEEEGARSCGVVVLGSIDDIRVTDVVEFIGVYGTTPVMSDDLMSDSHAADTMDHSPCVHAICHRILHAATETPLYAPESFGREGHLVAGDIKPYDVAAESRQSLLDSFTRLLQGDALAAEYMLLALISRVQHRVNATTVGNLTLNLTRLQPSELAKRVERHLADLVTKCVTLPMSLACLNHRPFWPRDTGSSVEKLASGRLQLSAGTCLLVDETALDEGKLEDTGVRNVRALARVVEAQQLDYAFPYRGEISFPTDVTLLIFSTARSMLPAEFVLPLQLGTMATNDDDGHATDADVHRQWRAYLALMRAMPHVIPETLSQRIQQDFVDRRRADTEQGRPVMSDAALSYELLVAR
ncbi:mini-chromosome maintenance replisome factor-domain-containing protein [Syncephalis pseudoplumigaleata]|uniref:Mini-chromosome maintenance replisome factor-domain-containing protein n=1 Tax=Syncephalis pseudoplumigaleata TaxID=1712513 RepID=A0A4P9Z1L8_9FUNG|nr:mini-chromosome maintenance replisome factor-domain-containing protein [Syncephalis pseudoplumigaleata]|eukprot:RKP26397.1 mini-chromosome maintenance replisome factor-domain-containing protein [Syncephalis pseudoplumigaleata]